MNASGRDETYDGLTKQQAEFVRHYVLSFNAAEAARLAGYKPKAAKVQGSRLLTYANVRRAIEKILADRKKIFAIDEKTVIDRLDLISKFNPLDVVEQDKKGRLIYRKDLTPEMLDGCDFSISPQYQNKNDKAEKIQPVNLYVRSGDRKGALELLGKHFGMFEPGASAGDSDSVLKDALAELDESKE